MSTCGGPPAAHRLIAQVAQVGVVQGEREGKAASEEVFSDDRDLNTRGDFDRYSMVLQVLEAGWLGGKASCPGKEGPQRLGAGLGQVRPRQH